MQITEENREGIHVFKLSGRLDSNTSPTFEEKIVQAIDTGVLFIIVDFKELEYLSSAGLRVLLKATKRLKPVSGKMVLCSMADYVREVFEISGFDTFLPIMGDLAAAAREFR